MVIILNMDQKNQYIEEYIRTIGKQMNNQFNTNLIDDDKIDRAINMFKNSPKDLETKIIPEINKLIKQVIDEYLEFKKQALNFK